ncbi:MAG: hypothetical protein ACPHK8_02100 [Thermoplasmatota archaeon]
MKEEILSHLTAGSDSISGIARILSENRAKPVHRLTVAGYLAALADSGILVETDRPPSKHYQLAEPERTKTLHQRVGKVVGEMDVPAPDRPALAAAALVHLLGRPIFQAELHHAGFPRTGPAIGTVKLPDDERRNIRERFRTGRFPLTIPRGDPLLAARDGAVSATTMQEVVRRTLIRATDADALVAARAVDRREQSRLEFE